MFKRNTPQKLELHLTTTQVFEDIENIKNDENQKNKLYVCLDDKIPAVEKRFGDIQEFLKGSDNLENTAHALKELVTKLEGLRKDILDEKKRIKDLIL